MFPFLNPLMLFGLAAGVIPLIIHFLTKRKARKVSFGSIRFLKEMEENKRSRIQIDFILILLLRILIILLFCAALARPLASFGFLGLGGKNAKSIIFLMDNSYSMGYMQDGESLFSKAKKKAKDIVAGISPEDEVNIIFFNEKTSSPLYDFTNNKQALNNVLLNTELSFAKTNGQVALDAANEMFNRAKNSEKIIYVFSDFQKNGFSALKPDGGGSVIPVLFRPEEVSNFMVKEIEFPNYISAKNTVRIVLRIKNSGKEKKVRPALYLDKNKIGETDVTLKKDSEGDAVFFYSFPQKGIYKGFAEISGNDGLTQDNRFYFRVEAKDPLKVLLLTDKNNDDENIYIKKAFSSSNNSPMVLNSILISNLEKSPLVPLFQRGKEDVIILNNVSVISEKTRDSLLKFMESGGGVLIVLGKNASIKDYDKIASLLPAKPQFKIGSEDEVSKYFKIMSFDNSHPIFKIFTPESFGATHFYSFYSTQINPLDLNIRILARFDDGTPFIIEKKTGAGKALLFTSSLDSDWSDFPLRPNFLPLLHQSVYYLAEQEGLKGIQCDTAPNFSMEESDLSYISDDEINTKFSIKGIDSKKANITSVFKEELSSILLILVLILMVFENILSNKDAKFIALK